MTDRLPVRKMDPVHGGTWAGIDVEALMRERADARRNRMWVSPSGSLWPSGDTDTADLSLASFYGIDVASIRRLAGEGE